MKFQVEDDEGIVFEINLARKGLKFSLANDGASEELAGVVPYPEEKFSPGDLLEAGVNYKTTGKLDMGLVSKFLPTIGNLVSNKPTLALSIVERVLDYKKAKDYNKAKDDEKAPEKPSEPIKEPESPKLKDQVNPLRAKAESAAADWIENAVKHSAILEPSFTCSYDGKMFHHDYDVSVFDTAVNKAENYPDKMVIFGMDANDNVLGYTDSKFSSLNPLKIENTKEKPADMSKLSYFWAVKVKNHVEPVERSIVVKRG